jgi:uncharacterized protein (TIRG00374 family)
MPSDPQHPHSGGPPLDGIPAEREGQPFDGTSAEREGPPLDGVTAGQEGSPPALSLRGLVLPLVLGFGVLAIIGWFTWDDGALTKFFAAVNPWIMAGAVGMTLMRVIFGGWRISFISRHSLGFKAGIRCQLMWDFASNISPSLVGGAPLTAYYISRESKVTSMETKASRKGPIAIGDASAVMSYVMLLDQVWFALSVPFILVASVWMDVIPLSAGRLGLWTAMIYFVGLMGYAGIFAYATLFRPELLSRIASSLFRLPFLRRHRQGVLGQMEQFAARASVLRKQKADFFLRGVALTAGTWLARYGLAVFVIWSFVPDVDTLLLILRSVAMTISSLVMPTPGGAGGIEGLYALFFGDLLPDAALMVPSLLTWRILGYYIFLVFGVSISTRHLQRTQPKA